VRLGLKTDAVQIGFCGRERERWLALAGARL